MLYARSKRKKKKKENNDEVTGSDVDDLDLGQTREAEKERRDKSVEENDFDAQEEEEIEEDKKEIKEEIEKFRKRVNNRVNLSIGRKKKRIVKFFQSKERAYWINIKLQLESNKNLVTPLAEESLPIYENGIAQVAKAIPKLQSDWDQEYEKAKRKFGTGKKEDLPPVDEPGEDDDDVDFDSKETSDAEDDDVTSSGVGGKLDKNVDYHIDNHVNISHVFLVGKWTNLASDEWRGNHVFSTFKELLDHDFRTCYNTTRIKKMVVEKDIVVLKEEATEDIKNDEIEVKKGNMYYVVKEKDTIRQHTLADYEDFGISCYVCHRENSFNRKECKFCGTNLVDTRYYKMQKPYRRVERIVGKDEKDKNVTYATEHGGLQVALYPEDGRRFRKSSNRDETDRWTKDQNIIWNYKNGFEANIAERDRLRFYYSMVTVEHYFEQQKDQILSFSYSLKDNEGKETKSGDIHIRRKLEE